jgi:phenylacetate-CoA ligase
MSESNSSQKKLDIKEIMSDYDKAVVFFHDTPAEVWEALGQKTAISVFQETLETIPAYKKFLKDHGFKENVVTLEDFSKVPSMDKYNYINKYGFNEVNSVKAGKNLYSFSLSSGTCDEPTVWPRYYAYEEYVLPLVMDFYMRLYCQVDKKSTLFINSLALGPWTGGMVCHPSFRALTQKYNLAYATTGTDLDSIVQTIKQLGKFYDQTIMWAYPTFARTILDKLIEAKIDLKKLNLKLFVGAEGHTVEWWQYVNKLICGKSDNLSTIMDAYGISEGGMPGLGTIMTNLVRVLCQKDINLRKDVFGDTSSVPDILQYNPGSYYIESIDGELVFTTKSTTPIVKYNVHDRGGVIKFREMEKILVRHGYDYKKLLKKEGIPENIVWQQPFFYCRGRGTDTLIINGANIFPEHIAPVFFNGKSKNIHSFKLSAIFDEEQHQIFKISLELKKGVKIPEKNLERTKKKYHDLIVKQLTKVNLDYADAFKADPLVADPVIEIFSEATGPFQNDYKKTKTKFLG